MDAISLAMRATRIACLTLVLYVYPVVPSLTEAAGAPADAADTALDRILELAQLTPEFEQCANSCQVALDQQILNCSGYRPERSGAHATPKCRQASYQVFEACMSNCGRRFPNSA